MKIVKALQIPIFFLTILWGTSPSLCASQSWGEKHYEQMKKGFEIEKKRDAAARKRKKQKREDIQLDEEEKAEREKRWEKIKREFITRFHLDSYDDYRSDLQELDDYLNFLEGYKKIVSGDLTIEETRDILSQLNIVKKRMLLLTHYTASALPILGDIYRDVAVKMQQKKWPRILPVLTKQVSLYAQYIEPNSLAKKQKALEKWNKVKEKWAKDFPKKEKEKDDEYWKKEGEAYRKRLKKWWQVGQYDAPLPEIKEYGTTLYLPNVQFEYSFEDFSLSEEIENLQWYRELKTLREDGDDKELKVNDGNPLWLIGGGLVLLVSVVFVGFYVQKYVFSSQEEQSVVVEKEKKGRLALFSDDNWIDYLNYFAMIFFLMLAIILAYLFGLSISTSKKRK